MVFLIIIGSTFFFCASVARNNLNEQRDLAGERWEVVQKYLAARSLSAREIGVLAVDKSVAASINAAVDAVDSATSPKSAYLANVDLDKAIFSVEAQDVKDSNRFAEVLAELETTDEKFKDAYKRYNEVVSEYNELISNAPIKLLAEQLDFKPLEAFSDAPIAVPSVDEKESTTEEIAPEDSLEDAATDESAADESTENTETTGADFEGAELLDDDLNDAF